MKNKSKIMIASGSLATTLLVSRKILHTVTYRKWKKDIQSLDEQYKDVENIDIVLTGSSSPRLWNTYNEDLAPHSAINTGFGGSKLKDNLHWLDHLVIQYNPKVVIFWAGTNDIDTSSRSKTGIEATELFYEYYYALKYFLPEVKVVFIPVNPTKERIDSFAEAMVYNRNIQHASELINDLYYVDTTNGLLSNNTYNYKLLDPDGLHLNSEGYKVVSSAIKPIIDQLLP